MNFLKKEFNHFNLLTKKAKDLLISYFFYSCANPLINIFLNAFIWNQSHNIINLAFYNAGYSISLPLAFYINGKCLKRLTLKQMYLIGAIVTALIPITIVYFSFKSSISYLIVGNLFGIGYGFYWANRNYLTLKQTESHNRSYFLGINFSLGMIVNIVVPLITGWLIYSLNNFCQIESLYSYQLIIFLALGFLLASGIKIYKNNYQSPEIDHIFLKKPTKKWFAIRTLMFSIGIIEGISLFLPTMLILMKFGKENILGTITAIVSLISSLAMYIYGRFSQKHHQFNSLVFSITIGFLISLFFGISFSNLSIILYICLNGLIIEFLWLTSGPISMDIMDEEKRIEGKNSYAMIFDQELVLDTGRVVSIGLLLLIIVFINKDIAIRITPVLSFTIQLIMIFFVKKYLKKS